MNKIKFLLSVISLATLLSCNSIDFSNPEEVIKSFRTITKENKNEKLYDDFLSAKSKEFVTKDEFVKARNTPDSILNSTTLLERKVSSYSIDVNNPTYRRFKVEEKSVFKTDTIFNRLYYSLINENGKWKVVWTGTLQSFATEKYLAGNYSEARKTLEKIIEINPFDGESYSLIAWCFYRDNSYTRVEYENGIVKNAKYAISLEEDNPSHYITLAAYYSAIDNTDLAIQTFERGLLYCQNKSDKISFYSNIAGSYLNIGKYEKAEEYIKKSIAIDDKNAFVWFKYGTLMQVQGKIDKAIVYFEKALKEDKMENSLQGALFYSYAFCCLDKDNCEIAREYVNKALDIEPNNEYYQDLYKQIKACNTKVQ